MSAYNISGLPDDLPAGQYDTRVLNIQFVKCRDGTLDLVFELEYVGPVTKPHKHLITFTKTTQGRLKPAKGGYR